MSCATGLFGGGDRSGIQWNMKGTIKKSNHSLTLSFIILRVVNLSYAGGGGGGGGGEARPYAAVV